MIDLPGLRYGIFSGGPLLDTSEFVVTAVFSLLARRLLDLLLDIGIRFGFSFFGIRTAMAGPIRYTPSSSVVKCSPPPPGVERVRIYVIQTF